MPKRRRRRRKTTLAKNPSPGFKRRARGLGRRAGGAFMGLNFREALKNLTLFQLGMMAAKWSAKRFGPSATQIDPGSWNYGSYLKGALGGVAAGIGMNMIKPGSGQRVMEGALNLMAFQLLQNELIQKNEWATGQFGQDESNQVVYDDSGTPFLTTSAGEMLPLDERHREELPAVAGLSDDLEPVSHLGLGEALTRPGPLGQADPIEQYYAAYRQR